jgi:predicted amino acid racemase
VNQDNFTLSAQIIELKEKPSVPRGKIGHDAFGNKPEFEDKGQRRRAIIAIGRQDVKVDGLVPLVEGAEIIGASSDHLLVDVTDVKQELNVGGELEFRLDYGAMLAVMTSPYVSKNYIK